MGRGGAIVAHSSRGMALASEWSGRGEPGRRPERRGMAADVEGMGFGGAVPPLRRALWKL